MVDEKLMESVSVALRGAGYTNLQVMRDAHGFSIESRKGEGGAYFRMTDQPKPEGPLRTEGGGPVLLVPPAEARVTAVAETVRDQVAKDPAYAAAYGIPLSLFK